ncbi:MAG: hypothetical protein ACO3BC_07830, partial [Ilumatobacteraceae bacterium]
MLNMQQAEHALALNMNEFSWEQHLLLPGLEMAANLLLLEYQKDEIQRANNDRLGLIQCASSQFMDRLDDMRQYLSLVYDKIPDVAMFQPVSAHGEQLDTITDNMTALKYSSQYAEAVSKFQIEHDLARQIMLNPTYYEQSKISFESLGHLLRGHLPVDDVIEILSDTAEQALLVCKIGNSCKLTHRNLGVSTLRAQTLGRAEARAERNALNDISNPGRVIPVNAFEMAVADRVNLALAQAQLIQNSLQVAHNACAKADPYLFAQLEMDLTKAQVELQNKVAQANLWQTLVPNYAQIFTTQLGDLFDGLRHHNRKAGETTAHPQPSVQAYPVVSRPTDAKGFAPGANTNPRLIGDQHNVGY